MIDLSRKRQNVLGVLLPDVRTTGFAYRPSIKSCLAYRVVVYIFPHQQAKRAIQVIQQKNKFHKGRQPEEQMPIMLAIYSTSRIIVTIPYVSEQQKTLNRHTQTVATVQRKGNNEERWRSIVMDFR